MQYVEVSAHIYQNSTELANLVRQHHIGLDIADENNVGGTWILKLEVTGRADAVAGFMAEFNKRHW